MATLDSDRNERKKPVIGVTGQIGAGKTLVASMLRDLGCAVIDADDLAHKILSEPQGVAFVREHFGDGCIDRDGKPDRKAIADIVFSDLGQKQQLESYIYPRLNERRELLTAKYQADPAVKAVVLEAPLLIETGLKSLCDRVILVVAGLAVRQERVRAYRSWSGQELIRREKFFLPIHLKQSLADGIVSNSSTPDYCRRQVEEIFSRIISSDT